MLKIRLQRFGKKNEPHYRVVLTDSKIKPQGAYKEALGFYNPRSKEKSFNEERIKYWLSKGAKASETVHNMLVSRKIINGPKIKKGSAPKKAAEKAVEEVKTPIEAVEKVVEAVKESAEAAAAEVKIEDGNEASGKEANKESVV